MHCAKCATLASASCQLAARSPKSASSDSSDAHTHTHNAHAFRAFSARHVRKQSCGGNSLFCTPLLRNRPLSDPDPAFRSSLPFLALLLRLRYLPEHSNRFTRTGTMQSVPLLFSPLGKEIALLYSNCAKLLVQLFEPNEYCTLSNGNTYTRFVIRNNLLFLRE